MRQEWRWLPLITLIPSLYALGWLSVQPLHLVLQTIPKEKLSLLGTLISFLIFVFILPSWIKIRWGQSRPWQSVGLISLHARETPLSSFVLIKGLAWACALLLLILIPLILGSWAQVLRSLSLPEAINAVLLGLGVGIVEELIFRGWLWEELKRLVSSKSAVIIQAAIFSLVHTRFNLGLWSMTGLLIGLFLFGVALALRRNLDQGSLWGSIGLHGGLVGGWFALQAGLIQLSPNAPIWLVGPGGISPNPLGGAIAIIALAVLIYRQLLINKSLADRST